MAGGVGSRFWPESRARKPKQLLDVVTPGTSLIQATIRRTLLFADLADTLIVTNEAQREELERQLPALPKDNIISEPMGRNTAPCIALGAKMIRERTDGESVMIVLPADHVIRSETEFARLMKLAARLAFETRNLVTVGIHPTRAETGYGYIQLDDEHLPSQRELPHFSEFELRDVFSLNVLPKNPMSIRRGGLSKAEIFCGIAACSSGASTPFEQALTDFLPEIMPQIDALPACESDFPVTLREAYSTVRADLDRLWRHGTSEGCLCAARGRAGLERCRQLG